MSDRIMAALFFWVFFLVTSWWLGGKQRTASVLIAPLLSDPHQISSVHLHPDLILSSHEVGEAAG